MFQASFFGEFRKSGLARSLGTTPVRRLQSPFDTDLHLQDDLAPQERQAIDARNARLLQELAVAMQGLSFSKEPQIYGSHM